MAANSYLASLGVKYITAPGMHEKLYQPLGCPGSVVIPPGLTTVVLSGNIGCGDDGIIPKNDLEREIDLTFANVETALKAAGVELGWDAVYQLASYRLKDVPQNFFDLLVAAKRKWVGQNQPVWTGVTVAGLYGGASLELTVYALMESK